ncbi:MAG TPA: hypothetical protein VH912_31100 [Streptosporangiaceae bacterium]|jgi:hypothetical protein
MAHGLLGFGTTFALAWFSAVAFLSLRCHGEGRPFGPSSRWWALGTIALTSTSSTVAAFIGVLLMRVVPPAVLGIVVPSTLYLSRLERPRPEEGRGKLTEVPTLWVPFLLERLHEAMADDRLTWCEARVDQMWRLDQLLGAARHYHAAIKERLSPEERRRARLDARLKAIEDRLDVVRLVENGAAVSKVRAALRATRVTREKRYERYRDDLGRTADLLRHHAEQDLIRILGIAYKRRFYRLRVFTGMAGEEAASADLGAHP